MFKVKCTGINKNYGEKGEIRLLADSYVIYAVKNKFIYPKITYDGYGSYNLKIISINDKCRLCGNTK